MYVFLSASVSRHTERVLPGSTLGREAISQSITSWCDDQWTEPRSARDMIHMESCILHRRGINATSNIAAVWWPISSRHHGIIVVVCRGTWHRTSHDQWPTLTGQLETAQWLGSSTPTAVNTSINMCGKTWDVQLNWRLFLQTNICICVSAHEVSPLMRGKVLRTLIDHRRPPAPAHGLGPVQQTSGRTTSQAVLQRNWNVGLHVILCYM